MRGAPNSLAQMMRVWGSITSSRSQCCTLTPPTPVTQCTRKLLSRTSGVEVVITVRLCEHVLWVVEVQPPPLPSSPLPLFCLAMSACLTSGSAIDRILVHQMTLSELMQHLCSLSTSGSQFSHRRAVWAHKKQRLSRFSACQTRLAGGVCVCVSSFWRQMCSSVAIQCQCGVMGL